MAPGEGSRIWKPSTGTAQRRSVCRSGSPPGGGFAVPPSGVPGQVLEEVCPGGLELLAVQAQPEEPAPEGVRGVVGDRAGRAGAGDRQGLVADREAQLDVGLDLPGVEAGVEGPELDRALVM